MHTPTVLALRCPGCGGTLHGLPEDVVFWCGDCGGLQELVGASFTPRTGAIAHAVVQGRGAILHLPVWAFRTSAAWTWPDPTRTALARHLSAPEWVYVTAFALHNASYFGDPGLIFTQRQIILERSEPAPLLGCTRSSAVAEAFVEPHLLSILDRRVDVTGLELTYTIGDAVLWGIPYYDDGATLVDGIIGLKLPAAAVDEIGALRAWLRGWR